MIFEHQSKNKYILLIVVLVILSIGVGVFLFTPQDTKAPQNTEEDWEEIVATIRSCNVESVFQAHSKEVSVTLKNGDRISGVEPHIDDIIQIATESSEECGDIIMATE